MVSATKSDAPGAIMTIFSPHVLISYYFIEAMALAASFIFIGI
jgi:hypothetical protein